MGNRRDVEFSDSIKGMALSNNFSKYGGVIRCEICNVEVTPIIGLDNSIEYDHIIPMSNGGLSILKNCQILCHKCNEEKQNKDDESFRKQQKIREEFGLNNFIINNPYRKSDITKEEFDDAISEFIKSNENISKSDFSKFAAILPPYKYVIKYYGNISKLKSSFGFDEVIKWNRENCIETLKRFVSTNGRLIQKDCTSSNNLPSLPTIQKLFPEYDSFYTFKQCELQLDLDKIFWDKEKAINCGIEFLKNHNDIKEIDYSSENNLPSNNTITSLFGSTDNYREALGLERKYRHHTKQDIMLAVDTFFGDSERKIDKTSDFFNNFQYCSKSAIYKYFGSLENFFTENNIIHSNMKKMYSKDDVDEAIKNYIRCGKDISKLNRRNLTNNNLPSTDTIERYYDNWFAPFYLFSRDCS